MSTAKFSHLCKSDSNIHGTHAEEHGTAISMYMASFFSSTYHRLGKLLHIWINQKCKTVTDPEYKNGKNKSHLYIEGPSSKD